MPQKSWGQHGTARRYRQGGCDDIRGGKPGAGDRCPKCIEANSRYNKNRRNGSMSSSALASVTAIDRRHKAKTQPNSSNTDGAQSNTSRSQMGFMESNVFSQTRQYVEDRPADVALAIKQARILDDDDKSAQWATVSRNLASILNTLGTGAKKKSGGRLAAVQAMSRRAT